MYWPCWWCTSDLCSICCYFAANWTHYFTEFMFSYIQQMKYCNNGIKLFFMEKSVGILVKNPNFNISFDICVFTNSPRIFEINLIYLSRICIQSNINDAGDFGLGSRTEEGNMSWPHHQYKQEWVRNIHLFIWQIYWNHGRRTRSEPKVHMVKDLFSIWT